MRVATGLMIAALLATGCKRHPITGKRQFNAIPDGVMNNLGKSGYAETLAATQVQRNGRNAKTLNRVGKRISAAANEPKFDWQYNLLAEDTINAWCMPGGYIGFYTGILPFLSNEAGMAFVMGHEVGHATARHSGKRLTQQLGVAGALTLVQAFLSNSSKVSAANKELLFGAIGLGAEVGVILPFSRAHESEADLIGLMYMSDAGYPPDQAIPVWQRMDAGAGARPPEFLSTHPSPKTRIKNIKEWLPRARKRYRRNQRPKQNVTKKLWGG